MSLKSLSVKTKIHKLLISKLKNKKVNQIYKKFEKNLHLNENFVVAVSGGPDSLALSFLAKIYSLKKKINCKFLIVDHKLRHGSTDEAKLVKKILKRQCIDSEVLTWRGKKPLKNVQSLAREKRYKLLIEKCKKYKITNILLGHHQDDLFENFFIRMLRGSGLKGLISLDKKTNINSINLHRPLLVHKKSDLIFLSKYIFKFYVKDPSNYDEKFQRIRIRQIIKKFRKDGFDDTKFLKTLNNLKTSNDVVNFYVKENLKNNSYFSKSKGNLILNKDFFLQPYEVVFRALSDSISLIGNKKYSARGKKIDRIVSKIKNNRLLKVTLGGCIIEKVNQTIIVRKEH